MEVFTVDHLLVAAQGLWGLFIWVWNSTNKRFQSVENKLEESAKDRDNIRADLSNYRLLMASHYYNKSDVDKMVALLRETQKETVDELRGLREDLMDIVKSFKK